MAARGIWLWLLVVFVLWSVSGCSSADGPEAVVRQYFDAVGQRRCAKAITLRPGFTEDRCRAHPPTTRVDVRRVVKVEGYWVVWIESDQEWIQAFRGFATLVQTNGAWVIDDRSFRHGVEEGLEEYLKASEYPKLRDYGFSAATAALAEPAARPTVPQDAETGLQDRARNAVQTQPRVEALGMVRDSAVGPAHGQESAPGPMGAAGAPSAGSPLARQAPNAGRGPVPRVDSLLTACWTPEQLRGRPEERKVVRGLPVDRSPPQRSEAQRPNPPLGPQFARSLRSVTPIGGRKLVALTFDLCEQSDEKAGYDGEVVDTLREQQAKATFYAGGKWMRSHPERAIQLMADPLFEVGSHAWTHGNLRVLRGPAMEDQILWTQAEYEILRDQLLTRPCAAPYRTRAEQTIPPVPQSLRFPYGACDSASLDAAAATGLYPVQWSIVTGDPAKGQSASQIVRTVLADLRPGAIIVAHANGRGWHTAEALKTLVPEIRRRGYDFVTIGELIRSGTPTMVEQCYEVKPGDNLRYDRIFGPGTESGAARASAAHRGPRG